jgi:hypothetical protein
MSTTWRQTVGATATACIDDLADVVFPGVLTGDRRQQLKWSDILIRPIRRDAAQPPCAIRVGDGVCVVSPLSSSSSPPHGMWTTPAT